MCVSVTVCKRVLWDNGNQVNEKKGKDNEMKTITKIFKIVIKIGKGVAISALNVAGEAVGGIGKMDMHVCVKEYVCFYVRGSPCKCVSLYSHT